MENMLGCCSDKGEIVGDQEDQGSFLEKTVDSRKHLGKARGMKECPREREIMNTILEEKRSYSWWGDEVELAISWIGYATVTNNPKYLRDVSLLTQRAVCCSPTFLFYHQPAAALPPTSISGPKLSCGRRRRQSRFCYGVPSSRLHCGH